MISNDVIERALRAVEAGPKRPFSPSARRVLLEAAADQRALVEARARRLPQAGDSARRELFERLTAEAHAADAVAG